MANIKLSSKNMLRICVSVISIICIILIGMLFYKRGSDLVIVQSQNEATAMARSAAEKLDGDRFAAIDSDKSEGFKYVYDELSKYKGSESLEFIYTMKMLGDELVFVVDTDEEAPADYLEPYEWLETMAPAFEGTVCADDEFTTDEWGTYISGYAPIFDSKNQVVGIVGCDIKKSTIDGRIATLRNIIIIGFVGFNAVMLAMFWMFRARTKSLVK